MTDDQTKGPRVAAQLSALLSTLLGVGAELGSGADTGSNTNILQGAPIGRGKFTKSSWAASCPAQSQHSTGMNGPPGFAVGEVDRHLILELYSA
jgi:type IV secretion system protein TrbI